MTRSLPVSSRYCGRAPLIWGFQSRDRLTTVVLVCLVLSLAVSFPHLGMAMIAAQGAGGVEVQAIIPAVLLGSLFAPLLDRMVIAVDIAIRARSDV